MNKRNLVLLFMAVLFTFAIFPTPAFSLSYDYFSNDGTWNSYITGLGTSFYENDNAQASENRGFETSFSATTSTCMSGWCLVGTPNATWGTTSSKASQGSYSIYLQTGNNSPANNTAYLIANSDESVGDSNIIFDYWNESATGGTLVAGYMNDINTFIAVETITNATLSASWQTASFVIPKGTYKLVFQVNSGSSSTIYPYLDNIQIVKNNVGTFRNTDPQYCSSISSCGNQEEFFPSSQLGDLYWVVDYVAGGDCSYTTSSGHSGFLTEGTNGMYYLKLNESVSSGFYLDVNLSATCIKVPFSQKSFFAPIRVYRYGQVTGGDFETEFTAVDGTCSNGWCYSINSGSVSTSIAPRTSYSGERVLYLNVPATTSSKTTTIWSENDYAGGEQVQLSSLLLLSGTSVDGVASYGYVDDSNNYTLVDTFTGTDSAGAYTDSRDWNTSTYLIPAGLNRPAIQITSGSADTKNFMIDLVLSSGAKQESSLSVDNNLTSNFGLRGTTYLFTADYKNAFNNPISTGDCNLTISGNDYTMTYNSDTGLFEYSTAFVSDGSYAIANSCEDDSFNSQSDSYSIEIISPASTILTISNLLNISSSSISDFSNDVNFSITDDDESIGWSIVSEENDYDVKYNFSNDNLDSRQYYVYTSDDGVSWTFNDSLTYGSGDYNSALQKIRDGDTYYYSFEDTLLSGAIKYYKLEYRGVAKYWETIRDSSDWININNPEISVDLDGQDWDLFSDSNYSNISSYTSKQYPDLTSSDLNTGLEFQFTAYASRETTIKIGAINDDGTGSLYTIYLGTGKQRYSVALDPSDRTARLVIQSNETSSARVYLTDYALIPKSYFVNRLELYDFDNSSLGAISVGGTSNKIIKEGNPFRFHSSAYDINGNLETLRVQAYLNGTIVKTYDFDLSEDSSPSDSYNWNELIDGVIDLNGWYANPSDLRDLYLTLTLIDDAGNEVAEQSSTIKLLQYPFFADDITLNVLSTGNKVGDNPKFRINLEQEDPDRFIGLRLFIYDSDHSLTDPNYEDVIFSDELNCGFNCSKELAVPDWVWESERAYSVDFMILVNTETENYNNDLLYKKFAFRPSYRTLETARILQVFERSDLTYRNDEKIPLVLQLRDVPYQDLSSNYSVYLQLKECDADVNGTCDSAISHKFNPTKFIYDEKTGYNYYYFDTLFYDDDGALLGDGNYIDITAVLSEKTGSHETTILPTLANKCASASYGTLFLNGWFGMNATDVYNSTLRALYGCTTPTSAVVVDGSAEKVRLIIDADHEVTGGANHSLICLNADNNNNYVNNLEQDIYCIVLFKKSQQSIDSFTTYIGNENSDYSEDTTIGQYLKFEIPADYIIFNDPVLLQQSLNAEYSTDTIDTIGELVYYRFDSLFSGIANPLTDVLSGVGTATGVITNYNFDVNWDKSIDPNYVDGIFSFKISGIKVLNQYDYLKQYPVLETQSSKYFTKWANQNNVNLPEQSTIIEVFSGSGESIIKERIPSNLVIFKSPTATTKSIVDADGNTTNIVATRLKFDIIEDMLSNNESSMSRIFLPLTLSYIVPDLTNPLVAFLNVGGEFLTNPVSAGLKYWFWFVILGFVVLFISVIYKNFKNKGE